MFDADSTSISTGTFTDVDSDNKNGGKRTGFEREFVKKFEIGLLV